MAYLRTWDQVLQVLGSRNANEIDDAFREAHFDFTERLADILVDVNADPWKLKITGLDDTGTATFDMPAAVGIPSTGTTFFTLDAYRFNGNSVAGEATMIFPIHAQRGYAVDSVYMTGLKLTSGSVVFLTLNQINFLDSSRTTITSLSLDVDPAIQSKTAAGLNIPIEEGKPLYIAVSLKGAPANGDGRLLMVGYVLKLAGA